MAPTRSLSLGRAVSFLAAPAFVAAVLVGSGSSACSTTASLVGSGGACQLATDCEEGLVCIPSGGGGTGRVCSNNLAAIQKTESTPPADASADAPPNVYDAPYDDIDGEAPPPVTTPDATTPDDSAPPPTSTPDATPPLAPDSAPPEMDSAPPPVKDAGSPADSASD